MSHGEKDRRKHERHSAYLAYRLGWLPVVLHDESHLRNANSSGGDNPLAHLYDWVIREGFEAIEVLSNGAAQDVVALADEARSAIQDRWQLLTSRSPAVGTQP